MLKSLLTVAMLFTLAGCDASDVSVSDGKQKSTEAMVEQTLAEKIRPEIQQKGEQAMPMMKIRGTVKYVNLEGGFYAIYADDGTKYTPFNLGKEYRIAGLVVEIEGRLMTDMMSIQQHGDMLKIEHITVVDASQAEDN
jgi:hypothetical protein